VHDIIYGIRVVVVDVTIVAVYGFFAVLLLVCVSFYYVVIVIVVVVYAYPDVVLCVYVHAVIGAYPAVAI